MRYALFGRGEGVRAVCDRSVWASVASVRQDTVTDASLSARKRGIRRGMSKSTAMALAPEVAWCDEEEQTRTVMETVWRTLWRFSPWLETIDRDAFCLQVSGQVAPLREVRRLLQQLDEVLSAEQRLRAGLAENPFLARALVEWSQYERVPGALYRKSGRQQFMVSPGIAISLRRDERPTPTPTSVMQSLSSVAQAPNRLFSRWINGLPVQAMWLLPEQTRRALLQLGIRRLRDMEEVGAERLRRNFGKEALEWLGWLQQEPGQTVRVNYPPAQWHKTWRAALCEAPHRSRLPELVTPLVSALATQLEDTGFGALVVGATWKTDAGTGRFERVAKRPLWRRDAILALVQAGLEDCQGETIEELDVYGGDLRPLSTVQWTWEVRDGALMQAGRMAGEEVQQVMARVNRKYPNGLRIGVRPGFRELRLQAVLGT